MMYRHTTRKQDAPMPGVPDTLITQYIPGTLRHSINCSITL